MAAGEEVMSETEDKKNDPNVLHDLDVSPPQDVDIKAIARSAAKYAPIKPEYALDILAREIKRSAERLSAAIEWLEVSSQISMQDAIRQYRKELPWWRRLLWPWLTRNEIRTAMIAEILRMRETFDAENQA